VLVGGVVDDLAKAEYVKHASYKAEVVQDLATRARWVKQNNLRCW
jgi:hypothetical protein